MKRARFNDRAAAVRALRRAGRWMRRQQRLGLTGRPPAHIAEFMAAAAKAAEGAKAR